MVEYFQNLFTASTGDMRPVLECVDSVITEDQNAALLASISHDEVRAAVFTMHPDKSPGPDGLSPAYFQMHWDVLGIEVNCDSVCPLCCMEPESTVHLFANCCFAHSCWFEIDNEWRMDAAISISTWVEEMWSVLPMNLVEDIVVQFGSIEIPWSGSINVWIHKLLFAWLSNMFKTRRMLKVQNGLWGSLILSFLSRH